PSSTSSRHARTRSSEKARRRSRWRRGRSRCSTTATTRPLEPRTGRSATAWLSKATSTKRTPRSGAASNCSHNIAAGERRPSRREHGRGHCATRAGPTKRSTLTTAAPSTRCVCRPINECKRKHARELRWRAAGQGAVPLVHVPPLSLCSGRRSRAPLERDCSPAGGGQDEQGGGPQADRGGQEELGPGGREEACGVGSDQPERRRSCRSPRHAEQAPHCSPRQRRPLPCKGRDRLLVQRQL